MHYSCGERLMEQTREGLRPIRRVSAFCAPPTNLESSFGQRTRAFTLVELLVVIAISGMLMAVLMPAISRVQEASRRASCQNHLRQLGLAVHQYVDEHGFVPSLFGYPHRGATGYVSKAHSAFCQIMAQLGRGDVFNALNFDVPFNGIDAFRALENLTAMRVNIETLLCPSDPAGFDTLLGCGPNNYRLCYGSDAALRGPTVGVFGNRARAWREVRDGLSCTAMASERSRGTASTQYEPWSSILLVDVVGTAEELSVACPKLAVPPTEYYPHTGNTWSLGSALHTCYNHATGPNSSIPDCSMTVVGGHPGLTSARRFHPGTVNVLYGDGRVATVSDRTDLRIWRAAGTAAAGD